MSAISCRLTQLLFVGYANQFTKYFIPLDIIKTMILYFNTNILYQQIYLSHLTASIDDDILYGTYMINCTYIPNNFNHYDASIEIRNKGGKITAQLNMNMFRIEIVARIRIFCVQTGVNHTGLYRTKSSQFCKQGLITTLPQLEITNDLFFGNECVSIGMEIEVVYILWYRLFDTYWVKWPFIGSQTPLFKCHSDIHHLLFAIGEQNYFFQHNQGYCKYFWKHIVKCLADLSETIIVLKKNGKQCVITDVLRSFATTQVLKFNPKPQRHLYEKQRKYRPNKITKKKI
eukprot:553260_1